MDKKQLLTEYERLRNELLSKQNISTGKEPVNLEKELEIAQKQVETIVNKLGITPTHLTVLDIGSGTGHKAIALAHHFKHAYGIETEKTEHEMALVKKKYFDQENTTFLNCPNEKIELPDASIDAALSMTVLEHVNNVKQSIEEIKRVLKTNGTFYLACPSYNWIYETHYHYYMLPLLPKFLFKIIAKLKGDDPKFINHINYVTPRRVRKLLLKNGFRIERDFSLETLHALLVKRKGTAPAHYRALAIPLRILQITRIGTLTYYFMKATGFYPAIELIAKK
ncbi:class I SAM-dependent methyltransferase [Candidatus Woesearchaeota archaeon]|nr:class I SAM-dependent methyltransferase [Candidatus Woesearchaeota archaeon]